MYRASKDKRVSIHFQSFGDSYFFIFMWNVLYWTIIKSNSLAVSLIGLNIAKSGFFQLRASNKHIFVYSITDRIMICNLSRTWPDKMGKSMNSKSREINIYIYIYICIIPNKCGINTFKKTPWTMENAVLR